MKKVLLLVVVVALVWFLGLPIYRSTRPVVELPATASTLGPATPIDIVVRDPNGVRRAAAYLEQNGTRYPVWEMAQPSTQPESKWNVVLGTNTTPQLQDGQSKLVVEATSNSFLRKSARAERDLKVITKPPTVSASSEQHYLYLGMAELTTFNVSGTFEEAGVRVGSQKFRAWPMPGGKPGYFSLFAFAWDMPLDTLPMVYASNGTGNDVTTTFPIQFPKKEQPRYTVHPMNLNDAFMQKVVGELDPNGTGDLVTRFVKINNETRRENNKTLSDLRFKTADRFLWSQTFQRQPGASTEATFADRRKYMYQGKQIDEQTHLGYDLAVTQHVGVQASNDGRVVYAAPLGIYGNCIVVDHGYGLQTIYGHLSQINVKEGDMVTKGQVMGLSGMTGMAGGDHIHFSMQLDGVQVDPKNWWDSHWIQDHVARRVELPGFKP